jgi:hypothetical protein
MEMPFHQIQIKKVTMEKKKWQATFGSREWD